MVRATRYPLGRAAKIYANVGDKDIKGKTVQKGEEGWYHASYRGLQLLCGREGAEAGMYAMRPSHEALLVQGSGFMLGCKAKIQLPPGCGKYPDDEALVSMKEKAGKKDKAGDKEKENDVEKDDTTAEEFKYK